MAKESGLDTLKKAYAKIQKKHGLPSFEELNRDFGIEKVAEQETEFLVREIRRYLNESFDSFLRFIEVILNPVNAPMFLYPIIKSIDNSNKEKLMNIHKEISKLELQFMKLINYNEEKEAQAIKKSYELWQIIKKDFVEIIEAVEQKSDIKKEKTNKGYFG